MLHVVVAGIVAHSLAFYGGELVGQWRASCVINGPWQAGDDRITRRNNRVTLLMHGAYAVRVA